MRNSYLCFFFLLLSFVDTILEVGGFTKMHVCLNCFFRQLFSLVNIVQETEMKNKEKKNKEKSSSDPSSNRFGT